MATLFPENPLSLLTSLDNAEDVYTMGTQVEFQTDFLIQQVRFWAASNPLGTSPIGAVYLTTGGAPVSQQAFPGPFFQSAWNTVTLGSPVAVTAGALRRIAVGPLNRYTAGTAVFPRTQAPLVGTGGYFRANAALTFPDSGPQTTWYSVDLVGEIITGARRPVSIVTSFRRRVRDVVRPMSLFVRTPAPRAARASLLWSFDVAPNKWEIDMEFTRVNALSTAKVRNSVFVTADGEVYNPTSAAVSFAFLPNPQALPEAADWKPGTWDVTLTRQYVAECLVGPAGAVTLSRGRYYRWLRIVDPVSGEMVIEPSGKLLVD